MRVKQVKQASRKPAPPKRVRNDPRGDATRTALIEKAEAMFAEAGINGVSLRQIGAGIGSANANIVGYYFGNKEALIEAILLKHRLPVEEARAELLVQAKLKGQEGDLLVLLDVLCWPLFEKKNSEGLHTYAAFLGSIARSSYYALRLALNDRFPTTQEVINRIAALLPEIPERYFRARVHVLGDLITGVLQRIDFDREDDASARLLYADALHTARAVFTAPLGHDLSIKHPPMLRPASIVFA
jgi:AcrR family transcriptional regulator